MTETFEEATRRFAERLDAAGWPPEIVWARASDVRRAPDDDVIVYVGLEDERNADAARAYQEARAAGRGVALTAVCTLGEATCATIEDGAGGGLDLRVPERRIAGSARWPVC